MWNMGSFNIRSTWFFSIHYFCENKRNNFLNFLYILLIIPICYSMSPLYRGIKSFVQHKLFAPPKKHPWSSFSYHRILTKNLLYNYPVCIKMKFDRDCSSVKSNYNKEDTYYGIRNQWRMCKLWFLRKRMSGWRNQRRGFSVRNRCWCLYQLRSLCRYMSYRSYFRGVIRYFIYR